MGIVQSSNAMRSQLPAHMHQKRERKKKRNSERSGRVAASVGECNSGAGRSTHLGTGLTPAGSLPREREADCDRLVLCGQDAGADAIKPRLSLNIANALPFQQHVS